MWYFGEASLKESQRHEFMSFAALNLLQIVLNLL